MSLQQTFYQAIADGDTEEVEFLLSLEDEIDIMDDRYRAYIVAVRNGKQDIVDMLHEHPLHVDATAHIDNNELLEAGIQGRHLTSVVTALNEDAVPTMRHAVMAAEWVDIGTMTSIKNIGNIHTAANNASLYHHAKAAGNETLADFLMEDPEVRHVVKALRK